MSRFLPRYTSFIQTTHKNSTSMRLIKNKKEEESLRQTVLH
jgi:hypothetical protein